MVIKSNNLCNILLKYEHEELINDAIKSPTVIIYLKGINLPIARKIVIECPTCGFTKVVTRGDCLPDASMFQKCFRCNKIMVDSEKRVEEVEGVFNTIFNFFDLIKNRK